MDNETRIVWDCLRILQGKVKNLEDTLPELQDSLRSIQAELDGIRGDDGGSPTELSSQITQIHDILERVESKFFPTFR